MRLPHEIMREREEQQKVTTLNSVTGRGVFQCRKALRHNGWDMKQAVEWLEHNSDLSIFKESHEERTRRI